MKKLRVGVFGCGSISLHRHLPEYKARQDVEVVAVMDANKSRAATVAEKFGTKAVATVKAVLAEGVDAVSICSPNMLHAEQAIAAMKAGAHVLCEKPIGVSVPQLRAMIRTAKQTRKQCMAAHNQRFTPAHVRGKQIYQSGALGKAWAFSTSFAHAGPESWSADREKGFFFKKNLAVVGAMGDLGVHKLDLVRWLLEDEYVEMSAMVDTIAKPRLSAVDDTAFAVCRMKSGILGQMFAGWNQVAGENNMTTIYCEKGVLKLLTNPDYAVIVEFANGERDYIKVGRIQTNEAGGQFGSGIIDAFVNAIRSGKRVPVPVEDGAQSVAAVLACVESAKKGRAVKVAKV
ncbi:MAG TPA: gfo/Idh/MocA family oxidoreductase [Phycisphaerales bacterium]|nr:gfo/Idh/MocA family oxidoreductase [Phycisphaerales bacterium]